MQTQNIIYGENTSLCNAAYDLSNQCIRTETLLDGSQSTMGVRFLKMTKGFNHQFFLDKVILSIGSTISITPYDYERLQSFYQ